MNFLGRKRSSSSSSKIAQNRLKFLQNMPLYKNERLQKFKGVLLMAGQINKILTNLKAAIERVAQEEGNKNGKIDTMCEKNKIAELLAGAKQEVGDFIEKETDKINNKKLTQKEREKQLKNLSNQKDLFEDKTSSLNISIEDSLPLYKKMNKDGTISDIDNLKHTYKGGGFDTMLETFEDGSYSANVYDKKGNNIGMKL